MLLQVSSQEKSPLEIDLLTEMVIKLATDVKSSFLNKSHLAIAVHFPNHKLKLHHAETATSATQVEAHLQSAKI
jgi:hypothetical protein